MPVLEHFGLKRRPFSIQWDPESKDGIDREALDRLRQTLTSGDGFGLLTGPLNSGKDLLIREMVPLLPGKVYRLPVPETEMTSLDFLQFLSEAFGLKAKVLSRGAFFLQVRDHLLPAAGQETGIVIILEAAHRLKTEFFKEIELLSEIRVRGRNPIKFLFVGLERAENLFSDPAAAKTAARITARARLKGFTFDDISEHIRESLRRAGARAPVFEPSAVKEVYRLSRGRIWAVDGICDLALLNAYIHGLKTIQAAVVGEYARQLGLPLRHGSDRGTFQRNLESVRQQLETDAGGIRRPEHAIPFQISRGGAGPRAALHHFHERDWEDRALLRYIDRKNWKAPPVGCRREGGPAADEGWNEDPAAAAVLWPFPTGRRRPAKWIAAAVGLIAVLGIAAVWMRYPSSLGIVTQLARLPFARSMDTGAAGPTASGQVPAAAQAAAVDRARPVSTGSGTTADAWPPHDRAVIRFEANSYAIDREYIRLLDWVSEYLKDNPEKRIILRGYSDNSGGSQDNLFISKFRAFIVKYYLIGRGVPAERMQNLGMGEVNPIASNDTAEGRSRNRRVEIELVQSRLPAPSSDRSDPYSPLLDPVGDYFLYR